MRKTLIWAVAALVVATPALAEEWDFVLVNNTGKEIKQVEVAPTGTTNWQKNRVDADRTVNALTPGKRGTIHFDKDANQCQFDVKATFADSSSLIWANVNVCDNSFLNLRIKDGAPTFTYNPT